MLYPFSGSVIESIITQALRPEASRYPGQGCRLGFWIYRGKTPTPTSATPAPPCGETGVPELTYIGMKTRKDQNPETGQHHL